MQDANQQDGAAAAASGGKFTIFRFSDSREPVEAGVMTIEPEKAEHMPAMLECVDAGILDGADTRLAFSGFGMTIVHVWFKKSFPLPLHTHDCDCLYYVIGGSLRLGTETLGPGDGFFLPANMPYTYTAGENGVEVLEFRNSQSFDLKGRTTAAYWARALALTKENHDAWKQAVRPSPVGAAQI